MKFLDIGEVSAKTGVQPSTLRYYEEVGLISSVARSGLRRQFLPDVLLRLKLIAMGKSAGFSLDEISGMIGKNSSPDLPRAALHRKADEVDRQIKDLTTLSKTLRHVADCRSSSHMECPTFRRLLDVALKRARGGGQTRARAKRAPRPSARRARADRSRA
jgi:DNA-binding transcriptional MerR regulator